MGEHTDDEIAVISYQISGSDTVPGGYNRYSYYNPEGTPTVAGDGLVDIWPCAVANLRSHYTSRYMVASPLAIEITEDAQGVFTAHITAAEAVSGRFMMVAYEDITHGGNRYRRWARQILTTYAGEEFSISGSETQHITKTITLSGSWNYANMGVVAWVYKNSDANWTSHESVQAASLHAGGSTPPTSTPTVEVPSTPTPTPPPDPSVTPEPTATQSVATSTPEPTQPPDEFNYDLTMEDTELVGGDTFKLDRNIVNPNPDNRNVDEYILLELFGAFYFWPEWSLDVSLKTWTMEGSQDYSETILMFGWPDGVTALEAVRFWGGLVTSGSASLIDYDMIQWSSR